MQTCSAPCRRPLRSYGRPKRVCNEATDERTNGRTNGRILPVIDSHYLISSSSARSHAPITQRGERPREKAKAEDQEHDPSGRGYTGMHRANTATRSACLPSCLRCPRVYARVHASAISRQPRTGSSVSPCIILKLHACCEVGGGKFAPAAGQVPSVGHQQL